MSGCPRRTTLPDRGFVYFALASNNLVMLRSVLNPLTLHDRRYLVNKPIYRKSYVFHACKFGFRRIVRYLVDECGADLEDLSSEKCELISPAQMAIRRLDFFMLLVLRSRSTSTLTRILNCYYNSIREEYFALACVSLLWGSISTTEMSFLSNLVYCANFSCYRERSKAIMRAIVMGQLTVVKLLLASGVDLELRNGEEDNALCLAILNNSEAIERFLITNNLYSLRSYAHALEICGAKLIVFTSRSQRGFECWRMSVGVRRQNDIGFEDKSQEQLESVLGIEFKTFAEIDRMEFGDHVNSLLQSLLIFIRLLSKSSAIFHSGFLTIAQDPCLRQDPFKPLEILAIMYRYSTRDVINPEFICVSILKEIYHEMFLADVVNISGYVDGVHKCLNFLNSDKWARLLEEEPNSYRSAYGLVLDIFLAQIYTTHKHELSPDVSDMIKTNIIKLMKRSHSPYPTTLLHRAVQSHLPLPDVSYILKCTDDANCTDRLGNTPLHLVHLSTGDISHKTALIDLLTNAGGHVDCVNQSGIPAFAALEDSGILKNPLDFLSLQCLAARAINVHGIDVTEESYPKILVKFINLHSG